MKEDYWSFLFGTMEGVQLVDTVGGERIRSKPEYLVGSPKLGHFGERIRSHFGSVAILAP